MKCSHKTSLPFVSATLVHLDSIWTSPKEFCLGQSGTSIGVEIGRSIEGEMEKGLEIGSSGSVLNKELYGARSKKDPTGAGDDLFH